MASPLLLLIGSVLIVIGAAAIVWPGSGVKTDRLSRTLQVLTGLIVLITGITLVLHGARQATPQRGDNAQAPAQVTAGESR